MVKRKSLHYWSEEPETRQPRRSQLKFLKDQVVDVLSGEKTLEPRPRSHGWIERFAKAELIDLTYGPRFKPPIVFATARLLKLEVRPFETTTQDDLLQIARGWEARTPSEFIEEHNRWYADELAKGYEVAPLSRKGLMKL